MNKLPFFPKFMIQALRRLLVPGTILLGVVLVISLLNVVSDSGAPALPVGSFTVMSVGSFILAISAFSFLRTRRASDFFHSLPASRTSLYFSGLAAVVIWVVGIFAADLVVHCFAIVSQGFMAEYSISGDDFVSFVAVLLSCLRVIAATMLVCAATGTLSANVLVTGVLLLSPTLILGLYQGVLNTAVGGILPTGRGVDFLGESSLLYSLIGAGGDGDSWLSWVIAIGVPLLYLAGGWALFVRRKSEMAGHGAATTAIHRICRIAVTIPFVAVIPITIMTGDRDAAVYVAILGCAAAVAYFGYELLTTRRLSSAVKAAPLFSVVVAIAVLASGGLLGAQAAILAYHPTAEQVSSVRLQATEMGWYEKENHLRSDYRLYLISSLPLRDDRAQQIICHALERELGVGDYDVMELANSQNRCIVAIKSGLLTRKRVVRLNNQEIRDILLYSAQSDAAIRNALTTLPRASDGVIISMQGKSTSRKDAELYESFCREFATLTLEQMISLSSAVYNESAEQEWTEFGYRPMVDITILGEDDSATYHMRYFVSPELTPETYALFKPRATAF